jgi:putative ABC transport system substrate-binding protein
VKRREFIAGLGAAAAWPLKARAQQPAMPVIGVLFGVSASEWAGRMAGVRRGLAETGFVEGRNVSMEYRWADGQVERAPAMAADLVGRKVSVILAGAGVAQAAMAATTTIPIVFTTAGDPVGSGLVADTRGNTALWFMNGTTVSSSAGVGNIPTIWTVQSVNAE